MARKGGKKNNKGQIRSKKKDRLHALDQLKFKSRAQEKVYEQLLIEYLEDHLPKIMDIVPAEVREERGDDPNPPGKLYKPVIQTVDTLETYDARIRTYLKWQVINNNVRSLGDIDKEKNDAFFKVIEDNLGQAKNEYSTKTYDSYVDGTYKLFQALSTEPEQAKVQLKGRTYAEALPSAKSMLDREYKKEVRSRIKDYSRGDYKRGKGYSDYQANAIFKATLKEENQYSTEEKLMMAILVYGTARNDEAQQFRLHNFNAENGTVEMLDKGMTKQNRGRVVHGVNPIVFELAEQLRREKGLDDDAFIFPTYDDKKVRELAERACRDAHVAYSGVHDLRKAFVEREEKRLQKEILKGNVTKNNLAATIMEQVGVKASLNPMVKKVKKYAYFTDENGKQKRKPIYERNADGSIVKEPKFAMEKLLEENIEDLLDLYMAQQLGHSDPETTAEYRMEKAKERRKAFRKECAKRRKKGEIE